MLLGRGNIYTFVSVFSFAPSLPFYLFLSLPPTSGSSSSLLRTTHQSLKKLLAIRPQGFNVLVTPKKLMGGREGGRVET